jgi:glucose-1-phosphate thymidylyltransferase
MTKGIVLAGGNGTRLNPITLGVCKSLVPVYDKPLIYYPLSILMLAGIRDILIITNEEHVDSFKNLLDDGSGFGINISYAVQSRPRGIADAFIIADDVNFFDREEDDDVMLILGDNIFHGQSLTNQLRDTLRYNRGCPTVFLHEVSDPERYGVAEFGDNGEICDVVEKPENPKSNWAVTGLYYYPTTVVDIAKSLEPSARGELEITDINKHYINPDPDDGARLQHIMLGRGSTWLDAGTFDALLDASNYVATIQKRNGTHIACLEEISIVNGWTKKEGWTVNPVNSYAKYLQKIIES